MPSVLVVDDSPVDRRLAGGLLQGQPDLLIEYAENGRQALSKMDQDEPDLVLTDLQMPDMDGLELVTHIRLQHPHVPVILMTAHGSETIAAQALQNGAASYVPKTQLAQRLRDTVADISALARADRSYARLIECSTLSHFRFSLDNDPALIQPLVDLVQQMVRSFGLCDATAQIQVGVALEQALYNAMFHGNLELEGPLSTGGGTLPPQAEQRCRTPPYCERRTDVEVMIDRDHLEARICDEGPGFDVASVNQCGSPTADAGRGLVLMKSFMDEVRFNERGNEVWLVKRAVPAG